MIIPHPKKIEYLSDNDTTSLSENRGEERVYLDKLDQTLPKEGYALEVNEKGVYLRYGSDLGRARALATIEQLKGVNGDMLPLVKVEDAPRLGLRSYMMDVSRYFFSLDEIKKQIDYLALYKFNCLHLHLSDDQGWRVEIKKYPKLTEIGCSRRRTLFRLKEHKGFYTQDELRELVEYAHSKGIIVMPEIDLPGHFQSALASYPELGCFDRKVKVAENFGIKFEVACVGKESTKQFIKDVLYELCQIFTDEYFHIGGDEVPYTRWELCPHCRAKMQELGAKNFNELQALFMNEIADYLIQLGKKPVCWNENQPTGLMDERIIWECWDSDFTKEAFKKELAKGRKIIDSKTEPYYLDLPVAINPMKEVYEYDYSYLGDNLIGAELCAWTELIPNVSTLRKKVFPRLLAGAERFWSYEKDYKSFEKRLQNQGELLAKFGVKKVRKSSYDPKGIVKLFSRLWWERRALYWAGLPNIITNAVVKFKYKNKS